MKRIHLVALPHTQVSAEFSCCAYTQKVLKMAKMLGHDFEIFLYAPEGPAVPGAKLIPCLTNERRVSTFGADDHGRLPAWPTEAQSAAFNRAATANLLTHSEPGEMVLFTAGWTHKPIADKLPGRICIEPGVGYEGIFTNFCAFESSAWMHHVYAKKGINDGRFFDAVIPNYFDLDDFPRINPSPEKGQYLMFLGRLIERKGLHIAAEIAKAAGMPLVVAGPGGKMKDGKLIGDGVTIEGDIKYVGALNVEERSAYLAGARALLVPTTYIEPFGGVAVEAMLSGTPVIATPWGAFRETVNPGESGFLFHTLREAVMAVKEAGSLLPSLIRSDAERYSLDVIRFRFLHWFRQLDTLNGEGWYQL